MKLCLFFFRMEPNNISVKPPLTKKHITFLNNWECTEYTVLRCFQQLGGALLQEELINVQELELIGKLDFVYWNLIHKI